MDFILESVLLLWYNIFTHPHTHFYTPMQLTQTLILASKELPGWTYFFCSFFTERPLSGKFKVTSTFTLIIVINMVLCVFHVAYSWLCLCRQTDEPCGNSLKRPLAHIRGQCGLSEYTLCSSQISQWTTLWLKEPCAPPSVLKTRTLSHLRGCPWPEGMQVLSRLNM